LYRSGERLTCSCGRADVHLFAAHAPGPFLGRLPPVAASAG
jgi:hypothetical protein